MAAIVHSQMLKLYAGPRSISGSFGASPSQAVVTAYLSQPSCVLSANAEGVVEDYTPASTTIVVEVSGRTDTTNWTISTAKSTSVGTVTVTGATVSVSGMTDDAGWVDVTASKTGYEPVTRRFTLAKVRQKGGVRVATTLPASPSEVGGELAIFLDVADPALRGMYGWSGTAWVKTSELLNGSVTAEKLAADAIQAAKFAAGIEPVSIVSLLPNVVGYTGPKLVFLTTDNKLYRYTGSDWVKELPAEDLTGQIVADQLASNSVTTGKIQAGAVSTDQLSAKAVTASKMMLTDMSNVYPDYDILDPEFYGGGAFARVASSSTDRGAYVLQIAANASEVRVASGWFQVEPSADYFVEISAHQSVAGTAGAAAAYVELGSFTGGTNAPTVTRAELILRRVNTTSSARADVAITTADTERRARLVFVREAGGTGVAEFGGPVIRRRNNAKLIVDGSVVATKIAADAVQTHHLLAGAVTAEKLTVNKLSAITADMGDVTAGTLTLSSAGYIRGGATSFLTGAGFWMGSDAGTYKLRAGIPGSSGFEWDGSAFNVRGPDGSVTISSGVVDWAKISGTGKPENGATVGADDSNYTGSRGNNLLRNSMLKDSTAGWGHALGPGCVLGEFRTALNENGAPKGYGAIKLGFSGTASSVYESQVYCSDLAVPCIPGERMELSARVGVYRGDAQLTASFLLSDGSFTLYVPVTGGVSEATSQAAWTQNLSDLQHLWGFVTAPATAVKCYMEVRVKRTTTAAPTDLYIALPYIGKAGAAQTVYSPWNQGAFITSSEVSTWIANAAIGNAQIANASITNAKIANATILAANIADGNITSAKIEDAAITNAKIGNAAVDTLQIQGNAVTIPVHSRLPLVYVTAGGWTSLTTAWINAEGNTVSIFASASVSTTTVVSAQNVSIRVLSPSGVQLGRNVTSLRDGLYSPTFLITSSTEAGTYTLQIYKSGPTSTLSVEDISLFLIGTKR